MIFNIFVEDDFKEVAVSSSNEDFSELERAKVINICGVDKDGRPVIVVAACRFPNNNTKEHQQLLRFIKAKLGKILACRFKSSKHS
jgi:hypothetical protein